MKLIKDFSENDKINQAFLVNSVTKGITTKGSNYLNIILQDASGTIEAKKWEVEANDEEIVKPGNIILVEGDVLIYKSGFQLRVNRVSFAKDSELDVSQFVASAPVSRSELGKFRVSTSSITASWKYLSVLSLLFSVGLAIPLNKGVAKFGEKIIKNLRFLI